MSTKPNPFFIDIMVIGWLESNDIVLEVFIMRTHMRPHNRKRLRVSGFRTRMRTRGGRAVLARRRARGRWRIAIS